MVTAAEDARDLANLNLRQGIWQSESKDGDVRGIIDIQRLLLENTR